MEGLEYESNARTAQPRERVIVERAQILACEQHTAAVGSLQPGNDIEQRRLTGAGLAHDGEKLAAVKRKVQAIE